MKLNPVFIFFILAQFTYFLSAGILESSQSVVPAHLFQKMPVKTSMDPVSIAQASRPNVEIVTPRESETAMWGDQVRYTITVTDAVDGSSTYGEINATECLLEVEYLAAGTTNDIKKTIRKAELKPEAPGLSLMKLSTCFGCHADKIKLAGPSFSEIAQRYGNQTGSMKLLGKRIVDGSSGVWGPSEMPSHPDITTEAAEQMATYIMEQGAKKNSSIYPGSEGTFRIIDKPSTNAKGIYRLTASYTSKAKQRGQHSIVLQIR